MKGLIFGGFRLPTQGHQYLINFAKQWVDELTVIVCSRDEDTIPGPIRAKWIREQFPDITVRDFHNNLPENPKGDDDDEFWTMWSNELVRATEYYPHMLFASEMYGKRIAEEMSAEFIPVDVKRETIAINSTTVRKNVYDKWDMLMDSVRPSYLRRVAIIGPESCGKTTLAQTLGKRYQTAVVPEWARTYLEHTDPAKYPDTNTIHRISVGQECSENALAKIANKVLICDTDHICTAVWCKMAGVAIPPHVKWMIKESKYDLRILMDDKVPFTPDILRYGGDQRQMTTQMFIDVLNEYNLPYEIVSGMWTNRTIKAQMLVDELLG